MSQDSQIMSVDEEEVQYVFNDSNFVLEPSDIKSGGLSDIIYSDGTRAILVNGQLLQADTQTVVLQDEEDLSQYYINDESGQILVADDQVASVSQSLDGAQIVQYIDADESTVDEEHQIIYINEEGYAIQDPDLSEYQITETQEEESTSFPLKTIKLETQVVDLEELMRQQGDGEPTIIENTNDDNNYQYAILKDGKLHIQSYTDGDVFPVEEAAEVQSQQDTEDEPKSLNQDITKYMAVDISKITGRNLLTGQTVTLHSYMDKLQKKIQNTVEPILKDTNKQKESDTQQGGLKSLLNKKFNLLKTVSGKQLVAKIIHVEKKETPNSGRNEGSEETSLDTDSNNLDLTTSMEDLSDNNSILKQSNCSDDITIEDNSNKTTSKQPAKPNSVSNREKHKIVIHEKIVSKECFEHISRTLSGLMNMKRVKKILEFKHVIVKVVEKKYVPTTQDFTRNVSYSSGCMRSELIVDDEGDTVENWRFVPDLNTKEAIFGKNADGDEDSGPEPERYLETANITVMITHGHNSERLIRVILNPTTNNKCVVCNKEFRSHLQLRYHMNNAHGANDSSRVCEICNAKFENRDGLQKHKRVHVEEGKLFQCPEEGCGKFFQTAGKLKRHNAVHNMAMRHLECTVCLHRSASESSLKKHLMTHMTVKAFYCDICLKSFGNQGDLNFHKRIHDPCKHFSCDVCQSTFSRHSNLQRHMEIHTGAGDLFWCTICGCSYHYMSSLTRHVVQNHIKRTHTESDEMVVENESEET